MDYIKEAENLLRHYRDMKRAIKNAEYEISKIMGRRAPSGLQAVQLNITGVRASDESDVVADMFKLREWTRILEENIQEVERIEKILQEITEEVQEPYNDILEYCYVKKMPREVICEELGYSKSVLYEKRKSAIEKFASSLFGIAVVRVI